MREAPAEGDRGAHAVEDGYDLIQDVGLRLEVGGLMVDDFRSIEA